MRFLKQSSIRWYTPILAILFFGVGCAPAAVTPIPSELARWHFAGTKTVFADKSNASAPWQTAQAAELRKQLTGQIGAQFHRLCLSTNLSSTPAVSATATKWIDRLWTAESIGEVSGDATKVNGWRVAVLITDAEHAELVAAVSALATEWSLTPATAGASVWTLPNGVQLELTRKKGWSVLSVGGIGAFSQKRFLQELEKSPVKLNGNWLDLWLNLASLNSRWSLPAPLASSTVSVQVTPKGNDVRTTASVRFLQDQSVKTVAWQVPTNTIRDPLISFTALQGTALSWFDTAWIGGWKPPVKPDQMYMWAQDNIPFLSFAALHVPDSKEFLKKTEKDWLAVNPLLQSNRLGLVRSQTNGVGLLWNQLPIIVPTLKPAAEPGGDYLLAGLFPPPPSTNNIPRELLQQFVARTNLVYYDWEVTAPRVQQWQQLAPILNMITGKLPTRTSNAGQTWIKAIGPKLGNAVTEATVVNNREFTVVRRSSLGLTGYELNRLVRWFDNPGFPFAEVYQTLPPMVAPPGMRK